MGDEPGNLPLLEFALTELWARRKGKLITHSAYEESGEPLISSPRLTPIQAYPVEGCDVCWPSSEEIYPLAANRISSTNIQLNPEERKEFLHFHDTRYKIIRWFIGDRVK